MKVLMTLHHFLDPNLGAPGATLSLGAALQEAGCEVEYYGFDQAFPEQPETGVAQTLRFPWRLNSFLKKRGAEFDVIDASTGDSWVWAKFGRSGSRAEQALVTRSHGLEHINDQQLRAAARRGDVRLSRKYPLYGGGYRLWEVAQSLRLADRCFLLNEPDKNFVRDNLGVPEDRLVVLPNGVHARFHSELIIRPNASPLRLAFTGTWIPRKGKAAVVRAVEILNKAGQEFTLHLFGTITDADTVRAEFPAGLEDRVHVTPRYKNAELPALLREQDILLFPSQSEGFSLALIEAMACGLAPISTPVGSAASVIKSGRNGFLIPINDADALAASVLTLARDPKKLLEMRGLAKQTAAQYRWDEIAARTKSIYECVLETKSTNKS